ncbi:MAG TPA: 23S rRNA (pseudouridine(1915)-N(3))-methyltransferase RlmH [Acidobacteriota bacterium]|nr:23S rRNA (pseudouridine(1915)-N(3))-methyltransferase RlmH [Acidobacteriota bacterium]HND18070.1 23S rRNA (pseudouridine(1915)-N(3))-methyltransferase RlmH [Acidobacteriota bacterium]
MQIHLITVGKMKSSHLSALAQDYLGRLGRFVRCEVTTVREAAESTASDVRRAQEQEATAILAKIPASAYVVLLDVGGEMVSSEKLAEMIERHQNEATKDLYFVIGGFSGVAESVRKRANWRWSLSKLTFTHEIAQVLVAEQLYRAYTILHRHPYSK